MDAQIISDEEERNPECETDGSARKKIKQTRKTYTLAKKLEVFDFKEKNSKVSYNKIAKIFTEKWGHPLSRGLIRKFCLTVERAKSSNVELVTSDMDRRRQVPPIVREFESELYESINRKLMMSHMTFQTVEILALRLQRSDKFKAESAVQSMKFSNTWWLNYQRRNGIRYLRKQGCQKFIPEREVNLERNRLLNIMSAYEPGKINSPPSKILTTIACSLRSYFQSL